MNVQFQLSRDIKNIFITLDDLAISAEDPVVKPASKPEFGDYQVDGILSIAKKKRLSPRELAFIVSQHLNSAGYIRHAEVAGPGFINITLSDDFLIKEINKSLLSDRLSVSLVSQPDTVVVDYSSPNIAKEMHVGNIRSTIIGDAVVRTLEFLGHSVIRANHIGDWGTQFGMLIAYMKHYDLDQEPLSIGNLEELYRNARKKYDADNDFANESRDYVVRLQCGDQDCQRIWQRLVDITMAQNQETYDRLGVSLQHQDIMGESLYNAMLPTIVKDLKARGLAHESEGATVVYLDETHNRQGAPMGVIIKKKDGGYLYSTTDIACAKYRYETYQPHRILYYVDSRQNQHLEQAWHIARAANYVPAHVKLEHHMFGMMLGKDGRPFKTRSGGTVKLSQLLNESVKRAKKLVREKRPDLKKNDINNIAEMVGIGAIKYSDLAKNRVTDYIFDWDSMLSFTGNTAPYIQYAHARIHSLMNKDDNLAQRARVACLENAIEKKLALQLLQFEEVLTQVAQEGTPHLLCNYLYQLSTTYSAFYENCAILAATSSEIKTSRMALSTLTAKTLAKGLELLGIPAPTEM